MVPPCWGDDADSITHTRKELSPHPRLQDSLNSLCANEGSDLGVDGARSGPCRRHGRDGEGRLVPPEQSSDPPGMSPPHRVPALGVNVVTCSTQGPGGNRVRKCQAGPGALSTAAAMAGTRHSISPALALRFGCHTSATLVAQLGQRVPSRPDRAKREQRRTFLWSSVGEGTAQTRSQRLLLNASAWKLRPEPPPAITTAPRLRL